MQRTPISRVPPHTNKYTLRYAIYNNFIKRLMDLLSLPVTVQADVNVYKHRRPIVACKSIFIVSLSRFLFRSRRAENYILFFNIYAIYKDIGSNAIRIDWPDRLRSDANKYVCFVDAVIAHHLQNELKYFGTQYWLENNIFIRCVLRFECGMFIYIINLNKADKSLSVWR